MPLDGVSAVIVMPVVASDVIVILAAAFTPPAMLEADSDHVLSGLMVTVSLAAMLVFSNPNFRLVTAPIVIGATNSTSVVTVSGFAALALIASIRPVRAAPRTARIFFIKILVFTLFTLN